MVRDLEPDLQVIVKGLSEEVAQSIKLSLDTAVRAFAEADPLFDLRRVHRIIVAADYAAELAELSEERSSKKPITHTEEDYAKGVAIVLHFLRGEGIEIVPVFAAHAVFPLTVNDPSHELFRFALHLLHHELCHVHDDNRKIDAFPETILKKSYEGKEYHIHPLADACWSEYFANRLSSSTAEASHATDMAVSFGEAIPGMKRLLNQEITEYRTHADLQRLLGVFERHTHYLPKAAAYVLGYSDGLGVPLNAFSKEAEETLRGSYFEKTWNALGSALRGMYAAHLEGWKNMSVYDPLCAALEAYFQEMGLTFENLPDGQVYVKVPFRPETMPGGGYTPPPVPPKTPKK